MDGLWLRLVRGIEQMKTNEEFEFQGHSYTIDLIGPKNTLLSRDDGAWQLVDTDDLKRFLEANHGQ